MSISRLTSATEPRRGFIGAPSAPVAVRRQLGYPARLKVLDDFVIDFPIKSLEIEEHEHRFDHLDDVISQALTKGGD